MKNEVQAVLSILLDELTASGEEHLPKAYAVGKAYAAAKSGYEIEASPLDRDISLRSVAFNSNQLNEMLQSLDREILSLNPASYATVTDYMKDIERVFDKYANRKQAWVYYAEQPFFDGFVQGSKEVQMDLATEYGVPDTQMGFTWKTAGDERVCPTCSSLDGQWFPLDSMDVAWSAHIGCRCPEYFTYGVNPQYKGEGMFG